MTLSSEEGVQKLYATLSDKKRRPVDAPLANAETGGQSRLNIAASPLPASYVIRSSGDGIAVDLLTPSCLGIATPVPSRY